MGGMCLKGDKQRDRGDTILLGLVQRGGLPVSGARAATSFGLCPTCSRLEGVDDYIRLKGMGLIGRLEILVLLVITPTKA